MSQLFDTIGQKAEQIAPAPSATNGVNGAKSADDDYQKSVEEIESLCMNCHENGVTRLLLTKIPYFREIVIMSFSCDKCGFRNNEVQPAGTVQPKGAHYELRLMAMTDFERQVIKSDTATVKFIELDLEVPAGRGQLTNVEGLLSHIVDDLEAGQEEREEAAPEVHAKIAEVIAKGRAMLSGQSFPFRMTVDDPAGNSFITPDMRDGVGKWEKREYVRTLEQNAQLGLADTAPSGAGSGADDDIVPDQVYQFPASCPGCSHPCTTNMKMVDIPHFRQVVIMSTTCDDCGYRSNDVKTGGEVPDRGKKMTLLVRSSVDLSRDILKSETCALECPELNLSVNPGTLGGRFTTVEGLLTQVRNDLHSQIFEADGDNTASTAAAAGSGGGGRGGDSLSQDERARWDAFFAGLDDAIGGRRPFTVILADPLASSYIQSLADDPGQPDAQVVIEEYERTEEEEEDLGLKDMKVDGYQDDADKKDGGGGES